LCWAGGTDWAKLGRDWAKEKVEKRDREGEFEGGFGTLGFLCFFLFFLFQHTSTKNKSNKNKSYTHTFILFNL
jgi:hypothetical protein